VPGTPVAPPVQTRLFGTQSATHAASDPFATQRPIAHTVAGAQCPVASHVLVAASPPVPPSASVQRLAPGVHSAPQTLALLPAFAYVTQRPFEAQLVAVADQFPLTQVWYEVALAETQRSSPAWHCA
jgi:hypothetical protein